MNALIVLISLFLFIALRIPIVFSMLLSSLVYLVFLSDMNTVVMAQKMSTAIQSFPLLAIPLFILAAEFMNRGKVTSLIFEFANNCVGHVRGGLGHVNVLASMIFAGMSGSEVADVAGLGKIEIKAMTEKGYNLDFSAAVTGASSIIGPIIPPSILMIVYGSIAEESVGRLFLGGAIPGAIMGVSLMIVIYFLSRKRNYPRFTFPGFRAVFKSFTEAILALLTPVIIMGGIISGVFTPTESGVVAVVYTFCLSFLYYKDLKIDDLLPILHDVAISTGLILIILGGASLFSWVITLENAHEVIRSLIVGLTDQQWVVLLILNILLLIAGCFFGQISIMLVLTPMIVPLAKSFGIDSVHLGIVIILNLCVGYLTPPFGMGLFVLSDITGIPIEKLSRAMVPFYIPILAVLFLVTYIPAFALYLPNAVMGTGAAP